MFPTGLELAGVQMLEFVGTGTQLVLEVVVLEVVGVDGGVDFAGQVYTEVEMVGLGGVQFGGGFLAVQLALLQFPPGQLFWQ